MLRRDIAVLGHVAPVAVRAGAVDDEKEEREECAAEDRHLPYKEGGCLIRKVVAQRIAICIIVSISMGYDKVLYAVVPPVGRKLPKYSSRYSPRYSPRCTPPAARRICG